MMKPSSRHKRAKPGKSGNGRKADFKRKFARGSGKARDRERSDRIIGVIHKTASGWRVESTNRRERGDYNLHVKGREQLAEGQIVVAEKTHSRQRFSREAKLVEVLGDINSPRAVSLIAIAAHDIPDKFPREALDEADLAKPVALDQRADLRAIPLVTIDGADARDFDDAVFAEQDGAVAVAPLGAEQSRPNKNGAVAVAGSDTGQSPGERTAEQSRPNKNAWHLIVAIADVAHYVKPGSALDKTAYERGNSTYFPDRVVPMLPEALSNELCSLKPQVERACIAAHLWIDKDGELTRWQFVRGVMKSHARLTYEQAQAAIDGKPDDITRPLIDPVLKPLYEAYRCLLAARGKRGTLELDLPERKVEIADGKVASIKIRERLDSHKLIEEFMILANVAAAAQLENKGGIALYRIHDKPSELKLEGLRDFLDSLGIGLVTQKQLHPRMLTQILENAAGGPHAQVVNEIMLRSQSQAVYSPENIGHFGLALAKYAHFTSPIRRYADLVVHRGLIRACKLGDDGLTEREIENIGDIAEHISTTERRSAAAERDAVDRFITLFMADRVGATFSARISGVARFGLFARLDETGADGIIPLNTLPDDYWFHDEKRQALIGRKTKKTYQLAQPVRVKLAQADRLTGSMSFILVADETGPKPPSKERKPNRRRQSGRD